MPAVNPLASARLIAPPAALAGCVYAGLVRDTRGLPAPRGGVRLNRFPALPYCGLTWLLHGSATLIEPAGHPDLGPLPPAFASGPQRLPFASRDDGPLHSFCLVLHPQALEPLTGVGAVQLRDRHRPLLATLPPEWAELDARVRGAADDDRRMRAALDWLAPRWAERRPAREPALQQLATLLRAMPVRAAAAVMGWTTRHLERRSLRVHGLTPRELRSIERLHEAVLDPQADARSLSELAQVHGFADQPHMTREWRRLTGLSPARLRQALEHDDEDLWLYRLRRHGRMEPLTSGHASSGSAPSGPA